ncbi:hypothetical protein UO65_0619 [Actinokineospora spheciospongiae]|uniref:Mobile element protein n=1 Tax=Actinokineospora spheciospongiae TaxID=909613 RepID=W7J500_9PSEU|nr:hypothetical protein UO65_0619 [Actinokineospora spheciospongiae]
MCRSIASAVTLLVSTRSWAVVYCAAHYGPNRFANIAFQ